MSLGAVKCSFIVIACKIASKSIYRAVMMVTSHQLSARE